MSILLLLTNFARYQKDFRLSLSDFGAKALKSIPIFPIKFSQPSRIKRKAFKNIPIFSIKFGLLLLAFAHLNPAVAKTDLEGFLLIRSTTPQILDQNFESFFGTSQFYLNGEFQPSNAIKTQVHFLLTKHYESSIYKPSEEQAQNLSWGEQAQIFYFYPSARWLIYDNIELKLGRNLYESQWDQFFSLNSYEPSWSSLDGVLLEYNTKRVDLDLWTAYLPKRWSGAKLIQDFKYGFGFFLGIDISENYMDSFDFHVAYLGDSFFTGEKQQMSRYGLSVSGDIVRLMYRFSVIGHSQGLKFKMEETMYHADLRYQLPDFFNTEIFVGYHNDSSSYNPWLYNRHKSAGLGDFFEWGNLNYFFIGTSFLPWREWIFQISLYHFNATDKDRSVSLGAFAPANKEPVKSSNQSLGQEIDIQIRSPITEELEIQLLTAFLLAQDNLFRERFYNNIQLSALYRF